MDLMSSQAIQDALKQLPEWQYQDNAITRNIEFPNFLRGIEFVNAVAHLAERQNHHPDIMIHYRNVTLRYWTHTANGVTQLDFDGAKEVDQLMSQFKKLTVNV